MHVGPPFTHPSIPHQAHYIGSTSPRNCPSYYLEAIYALVQTYNLDIQHGPLEETDADDPRISDVIPLVVNTMGWTKGLGADLSRKLEEMVEPSAIFNFDAPVLDEAWTPYMNTPEGASGSAFGITDTPYMTPLTLAPIPQAVMSTRFSPADHRNIMMLSYFHAIFPPALPNTSDALRSYYAISWNTSLPLCAQPPFELTARDAIDDVVLLGPGSEDVVPSEIGRVLNGAVVALVSCEPGTVGRPADDVTAPGSIPYARNTLPPSPSLSSCHGLALIRSVLHDDVPPTKPILLHILTPLPPSLLSDVKPLLLVKGELELPVWGMLDFRSEDNVAGVERSSVPYLKWGKGEGVGGEKRRVRRNLMRRGQM